MGWKSFGVKPYANYINRKIKRESTLAVEIQEKILMDNIRFAANTQFGKEHDFKSIKNYEDYKKNVPLRNYEALKPYVEKFLKGEKDILWPGLPKYVVGTSGTTSGIKYIPLSKESIPYHLQGGTFAGINYAYKKNLLDMFDGKLIFLTGSPVLDRSGVIPVGRLSGIVNHEVPSWIRRSQVPSFETNSIPDWNQKITQIAEETKDQDLRMISGIPPWVVMYLERLLDLTGKNTIIDIFPNLRLMIHGGVNYKPYEQIFNKLIGADIDFVETYPSTEAFVAFQDGDPDEGLLLNANGGSHFEFVPADEIHLENPSRLSLREVEINKDYAIIINNSAGLWGSKLGDLVRFNSLAPYRLRIIGRTAQFISAFGEHVIASEVDAAISRTIEETGINVKEFTVAPYIKKEESYHHWLIEFENEVTDLENFTTCLNQNMRRINFHYDDLIGGSVIKPLKITKLSKNRFRQLLEKKGKLGGQNKVPRLCNDHFLADQLLALEQHKTLAFR